MNTEFPQLFELGLSEKLQLVEDLWDDIASSDDAVPVYQWQKEELDRRKRDYLKNPESGISWEEAKAMIRKQVD